MIQYTSVVKLLLHFDTTQIATDVPYILKSLSGFENYILKVRDLYS